MFQLTGICSTRRGDQAARSKSQEHEGYLVGAKETRYAFCYVPEAVDVGRQVLVCEGMQRSCPWA